MPLAANEYRLQRKQDKPQEEAPTMHMQRNTRWRIRLVDNWSKVREPKTRHTEHTYEYRKPRKEKMICFRSLVLHGPFDFAG
jgi:hypothetical protein